MKDRIQKEIVTAVTDLKKHLPVDAQNKILLTGGSAAFFYGSDRPFSHDMDFMVCNESVDAVEKALKTSFKRHIKKPVFHSLKAVFSDEKKSYDLIAESVIQPAGHTESYTVYLTDDILGKKKVLKVNGQTLYLVPKELLALIKLLAGRGEELGKYDLYDVWKIVTMNEDFDLSFFSELIKKFGQPLEKSLPLLLGNGQKILTQHPDRSVKRLLEALTSLRPSA